jgi:hypothetical protein
MEAMIVRRAATTLLGVAIGSIMFGPSPGLSASWSRQLHSPDADGTSTVEVSAHPSAVKSGSGTASTDTASTDTARMRGDHASIDPVRFGIVTGTSAGLFVAGHVFFSNLWYKDEKVDFHFTWEEDWKYALGADKLGHAILPYIGADIYRQAFEWTGMRREPSVWTAAALASLYTTYIEIRDGFSIKWGFSWGDWAANTLGIGWRVLEFYEPTFENVRFKVSYYPSDAYEAGQYDNLIDDYESTYLWASVNVDPLLPTRWLSWCPDWINLAIGHSVKGIVAYDGSGRHELFISLDWDTEGLPGDGAFWGWLKKVINYYHLPAPALQIAPDVVFWGLKF